MKTVTAISSTTKSSITRKLNNAFRRKVLAFEAGVLEAKIEAMTEEQYGQIAEALDEIRSEFETRMEQFEEELWLELDEQIVDVVGKFDRELVEAVADSECSTAHFNGLYPIRKQVTSLARDVTHIEWVKLAPIVELHEKYDAAVAEETPEITRRPVIIADADGTGRPVSSDEMARFSEQAEANFSEPGQTCGTCGRQWINGKCEGGFINHKL